jgi:hypothetical protein
MLEESSSIFKLLIENGAKAFFVIEILECRALRGHLICAL